MSGKFIHREGREIAHPKRRLHQGRLLYFASAAELADPEWVSKFKLNNPRVRLVENKPVMIR